MASERVQRRLSAILAADVAGYSRLMGGDEEGTLAQLKAHRCALLDPKIREHQGRIVKTTGDGLLAEFASVVDAVRCATEVQRGMVVRNADTPQAEQIEFRIGINIGDIIIDGDDIFGDGVNVAARLEALAEPGGICISKAVRDQVRDRLDIALEDAGDQQLKNIARPVRVYRVALDTRGASTRKSAPLPLPDKASIAVLPFQSLSGNPEHEYFADGVVEEITSALSHNDWLSVVARNSSFAYKNRAVDVKQIGRELGVRYVLEGSVRQSVERVRISAQLVAAETGAHVWADHFEGTLDNIFAVQDELTKSVVGAIAPKLFQAEFDRAKRKPTENPFDYLARGFGNQMKWNREANAEALRLLRRAIDIDPEFALAYGAASNCYTLAKSFGWLTDPGTEIPEGVRLARRALDLGKDDSAVLTFAALAIANLDGDVDSASDAIDRALKLNPTLAASWAMSAWIRVYRGESDRALEDFAEAVRLSPQERTMFAWQTAAAYAHFFCGRYDKASGLAEKTAREQPGYLPASRLVAASAALAGHLDQAEKALARLNSIDPLRRVSDLGEHIPLQRREDLNRLADGLRMAGLPD